MRAGPWRWAAGPRESWAPWPKSLAFIASRREPQAQGAVMEVHSQDTGASSSLTSSTEPGHNRHLRVPTSRPWRVVPAPRPRRHMLVRYW